MKYTIIITACCISCAAHQAEASLPTIKEALAQLDVKTVEPDIIPEDLGAGQYLEMGFMFHGQGKYELATKAFEAAIGTQYLNDAGRALAYWHIADCGLRNNDHDQVAEAYHSFIITAQDILSNSRRYAVVNNEDFVSNFQLQQKLIDAQAFMNVIWSVRTNDYGKSLKNPIVVRNIDDANAIASAIMIFCKSRCSLHRSVLADNGIPVKPHTERILLVHITERTTDSFFVVVIGETK